MDLAPPALLAPEHVQQLLAHFQQAQEQQNQQHQAEMAQLRGAVQQQFQQQQQQQVHVPAPRIEHFRPPKVAPA